MYIHMYTYIYTQVRWLNPRSRFGSAMWTSHEGDDELRNSGAKMGTLPSE